MTDGHLFDDVFEEEGEGRFSLALFEGDTSELYPEQRHCLHALLKHRYISAERHPDHWEVLLASSEVVKSRLNEIFLDLHIDRQHQVAFKRQARSEDDSPLPSLLRDASHTKEETIMLVHLRQRFFTQRQEGDEAVFIDRQSLIDEVADQRPEDATNRAMDFKRASKSVDTLATAGVLLRTADPDRFRISPIVEVLMPIERLRALWTWLLTNNGDDDAPDEPENEPELLLDIDAES